MAKQIIILEGRNMVRDALVSKNKIQSVLVSNTALEDPRIREIEGLANRQGVLIQKVRPEQIEHLTESGNAQGVIAYMELPEMPTLEKILKAKPSPFLLLFNKLDYEQNLGAILSRKANFRCIGAATITRAPNEAQHFALRFYCSTSKF